MPSGTQAERDSRNYPQYHISLVLVLVLTITIGPICSRNILNPTAPRLISNQPELNID